MCVLILLTALNYCIMAVCVLFHADFFVCFYNVEVYFRLVMKLTLYGIIFTVLGMNVIDLNNYSILHLSTSIKFSRVLYSNGKQIAVSVKTILI